MSFTQLVEVELRADDKVIRETLSRIGIANKKNYVLYPSCYLYQNYEKYYIVHFKQLFALTRTKAYDNISEKDYERRNSVIFCLKNWGLVDVNYEDIKPHNERVFVLAHKDKHNWEISHKFNMNSIQVTK